MRVPLRTSMGVVAWMAAFAVSTPPAGSAPASEAFQDRAYGSGGFANSGGYSFRFEARKGPFGTAPEGQFAFFGPSGELRSQGAIECLRVQGNTATLGGTSTHGEVTGLDYVFTVQDNGPLGAGDRVSTGEPVPGGDQTCPTLQLWWFVSNGDVAVVDAPPAPTTKDQCRNGGWETYGVFKNQGDCVSFVATGGKNPPSRPLG